jgi:hypothetical protein
VSSYPLLAYLCSPYSVVLRHTVPQGLCVSSPYAWNIPPEMFIWLILLKSWLKSHLLSDTFLDNFIYYFQLHPSMSSYPYLIFFTRSWHSPTSFTVLSHLLSLPVHSPVNTEEEKWHLWGRGWGRAVRESDWGYCKPCLVAFHTTTENNSKATCGLNYFKNSEYY